MQATSDSSCIGFTPQELLITFETQAEANEFYTLFNLSAVVGSIPNVDSSCIRDAMEGYAKSNDVMDLLRLIKGRS